MKTRVEIDSGNARELKDILAPGLTSDQRVSYELEARESELVIEAETERLGVMRGVSDTVFRLAMLADKLY